MMSAQRGGIPITMTSTQPLDTSMQVDGLGLGLRLGFPI